MSLSQTTPADVLLSQMIFGKWLSMALSVAARLRIADHLADKPLGITELAKATNTHERSLMRLMRALASVGVFQSTADGAYGLTEIGQYLRSGVKGSMRGVADYCGATWSWRAWEQLQYSIETGETAFDHVFGQRVFDYLAGHPDESEVFNEGMTGFSGKTSDAVVAAYDFSRFKTLADIGGGHGYLLASILKSNPSIKGVLFDAPHVVAMAEPLLKEFGVHERCRVEGGDFFQSIPGDCDAYIMKHIVHDWNDSDALRILKTLRRQARPGATLLIVEMVIPPGDAPHPGKLLDLEMLVVASGQERTEKEYAALLSSAGFSLQQILPTHSPNSVVEAIAV